MFIFLKIQYSNNIMMKHEMYNMISKSDCAGEWNSK